MGVECHKRAGDGTLVIETRRPLKPRAKSFPPRWWLRISRRRAVHQPRSLPGYPVNLLGAKLGQVSTTSVLIDTAIISEVTDSQQQIRGRIVIAAHRSIGDPAELAGTGAGVVVADLDSGKR